MFMWSQVKRSLEKEEESNVSSNVEINKPSKESLSYLASRKGWGKIRNPYLFVVCGLQKKHL
jgi:hypothetical protein